MKKMHVYAPLIGIAVGAVYLLYKNEKSNNDFSKNDNKVELSPNTTREEPRCESNVMEDMYQAKSESAQAVHERHSEAAEIISDAFKNIFSEVEPVVLGQETEDIVIDSESIAVMKKLDSISDELDNLLT